MVKHVLPDKLFQFGVHFQSIHQEFYAPRCTGHILLMIETLRTSSLMNHDDGGVMEIPE